MHRGELKQKILLLLSTGIVLHLAHSAYKRKKALKDAKKMWSWITRDWLYKAVKEFYEDKLVSYRYINEETIEIVLTEKGKKRALRYKIKELELKKPKLWDKKWRIIIFDIPEKLKHARNALREKLKELGFIELQKSVFVCPWQCKDEIDFLVEFFDIRSYIRLIEATKITNEEELRLKFDLF